MGYDRSKFKSNQQAAQAAKSTISSGGGYVKIDRHTEHKKGFGRHTFRIMPTENGYPYLPFRQTFLEVMVDTYNDDGEKEGQELKLRPVPIATVHGKKRGITKDVIEEYVALVLKQADELYPRNNKALRGERDEYLAPIYGSGSGKNFKSGINPKSSWICYAEDAQKIIAALELNQGWFDKMSQLTSKWSDEEMRVDIFGDPDEGFRLVIERTQKDIKGGKKIEYVIETEDVEISKMGLEKYFESTRLSDEQLQGLSELPDLEKVYGDDTYKERHLKLALDGLKRIDEKHGFGVYDSPEFIAVVEEVESFFGGDDYEEEEETENQDQEEEVDEKEDEVPAPPPPAPKKEDEEPNVNGITYQMMVDAGWTDEQLLHTDYAHLVPKKTPPPPAPPKKDAVPPPPKEEGKQLSFKEKMNAIKNKGGQ